MAGQFQGGRLDRHYTGFFELFNRQQFYEAHEVLEHIWLPDKHGLNGSFYKGLIQLAGAFVHLQKRRPQPASALFKLALANLEKYPPVHEHLDVAGVIRLIEGQQRRLDGGGFPADPAAPADLPKLHLNPPP